MHRCGHQYSAVQYRTVQYGTGTWDKIPTLALAGHPRAHEGGHKAYKSTYPSLSGRQRVQANIRIDCRSLLIAWLRWFECVLLEALAKKASVALPRWRSDSRTIDAECWWLACDAPNAACQQPCLQLWAVDIRITYGIPGFVSCCTTDLLAAPWCFNNAGCHVSCVCSRCSRAAASTYPALWPAASGSSA